MNWGGRFIQGAIAYFLAATAVAAPITINGSGSTTGLNGGFGDVFGATSTMAISSNLSGDIDLTVTKGSGDLNDIAVIYIDTDDGVTGIANTSLLMDTADPGRAAISGGSGLGSNLGFAAGFAANYAITIETGFSGLFEIASSPGNFNYVGTNCCAPATSAESVFGISFNMADLGLGVGDSFRYFLTYLNPVTDYRSNEFHGVSAATAGGIGNIGSTPFNLGADDYVRFTSVAGPSTSVPAPPTLLLLLAGVAALRARRRAA